MEDKEVLIKEMKEALNDLDNSFIKLNEIWDKFEFNEDKKFTDFSVNIMSREYPFKHSFDDECLYVRDWVENVIDNLDYLKYKNLDMIKAIVDSIKSLPENERKNVLEAVNSIVRTE